jgi:TRAP-type C4-dicarboxylate transport system permease small subunit
MHFLKRISDWVDWASVVVAIGAIVLILLISIYGAFFRYVLNNPLPWPLPVERLLMVWAALLGIPAALKRGQHMGVEGLIQILPRKVEITLRYVAYALVTVFVVCLLWYGIKELTAQGDLYMITSKVRISSKWLQAAIPVSAAIQLIHIFTAPHIIKLQMESDQLSELD